MKKKIEFLTPLFWLLFFTFFKGIIWLGAVPLWHFPDEQAHFAQLQNIAERKNIAHVGGKSTSREIYESEVALRTLRDERGNNRFTFHPEYNLSYTNSFTGKLEPKLKSLDMSTQQEMAIAEATSYPFLYYTSGAFFYRLAYYGNLFIRVFTVRLFSVLLTTATVWLAYKIGKLVFKKELLALALGVLVSFQPMFTFIGTGVTSDVLFNFFFTLFILGVLLLFPKPNFKSALILISSLIGGLLTKQQMMIAVVLLPPILTILIWQKLRHVKKKSFSKRTIFITLASFLLILLAAKYGEVFRIKGYIGAGKDDTLRQLGLTKHLIWTVRHTIAEVLPWYWGVFKWLGVVLPRWVNRVQMRLLALSVIGLFVWLFKLFNKRKIKKIDWQIGFLALVSFVYFMAVTLWDWHFRQAYGFSFGIQGRYFFPTIVAHMGLILFGLIQLVPQKWQRWLIFLLIGWWISLSHIGLWTVLKSYYQLWPLETLWHQASQYKPFFFKSYWWFLWLGLYLVGLAGLTVNLFTYLLTLEQKIKDRKNKKL